MIDFKSATPTYYYYNVDAQDVIDATAEYSQHNEVSYKLSKFIKMGSTSLNNNYDDAYENTQYYLNSMRIASEEFIFIVDFAETELNSHKLDETLLLEIRDSENQTKIGVLGINYENLTYNIYNDSDALVGITASLSKEEIYLKDSTVLSVETNFSQTVYNGISIQDTTFFNKKLGLKITIFDENDNQLNISSLLGVSFTLKGVKYFPRMDGTTRFTIATKVANVLSKITINTVDSNLPSGTYKIRIESFGSADGIYYGLVSSDVKEVTLNVLNNIYGLKSTLEEKFVTIDKVTGETMKGNNALMFNIEYSSGLANPNLRISLKRRLYDEVHSLEYEAVDFSDYFTHSYASIGDPEDYEYFLPSNLAPTQNLFLYLKENLTTGTYKITFSLYDKNSYIGEVYNYIVIR